MSRDEYARQFYKTRMCRFYANSKCTKGFDCSHAHSRDELIAKPNLRKTSLCRHWSSGAPCEKGSKCPYAHGEQELRHLASRTEGTTRTDVTSSNVTKATTELTSKADRDLISRAPTRSSTNASVRASSIDSRDLCHGRVQTPHQWHGPSWFCYDGMYVAPAAYQFAVMRSTPRVEDEHSPRFVWPD